MNLCLLKPAKFTLPRMGRKNKKIMNVLVTGVSRGVGLAICEVLLKQGFTVYGVSRSKSENFILLQEKYTAA